MSLSTRDRLLFKQNTATGAKLGNKKDFQGSTYSEAGYRASLGPKIMKTRVFVTVLLLLGDT